MYSNYTYISTSAFNLAYYTFRDVNCTTLAGPVAQQRVATNCRVTSGFYTQLGYYSALPQLSQGIMQTLVIDLLPILLHFPCYVILCYVMFPCMLITCVSVCAPLYRLSLVCRRFYFSQFACTNVPNNLVLSYLYPVGWCYQGNNFNVAGAVAYKYITCNGWSVCHVTCNWHVTDM
jgi:hypothetical protein